MSKDKRKVFTISWKIFNYSFVSLKCGEALKSPVCCIEYEKGSKWFLRLYPNGYSHEYQNKISLFLYRGDGNGSVSFAFALELVDPSGKILKSLKIKTEYMSGQGWGQFEFVSNEKLREFMDIYDWEEDMLWVRCHVFDPTFKLQATQCEVETKIKVHKCSLRWNVEIPDCSIRSKVIKILFTNETEFKITLTAVDKRIKIVVQNTEKLVLGKLYKLVMSILNSDGVQIDFEDSTFCFQSMEENDFLKFDAFIEEDCLKNELGLLYGKSFSLMCDIYSPNGKKIPVIESNIFDNVPEEISQTIAVRALSLQDDLKNMLMNEKHCDVKLKIDEEIVPAHKSLLCARSPVFSTMFDQEMLENQTGIVDISDIEIGTLRSFLEFLYTDTLTNTDYDHVLKMILVADKYQVNKLKELCSDVLIQKLSIENVCEVLSVGEMVNQSNLKLSAIEYIKIHKKNIISTPEWSDWVEKNMKLAVEVLSKLLVD